MSALADRSVHKPSAKPGRGCRTAVAPAPEPALQCRVRLADGRVYTGSLPARKHRAIQLGMLHGESDGLVELTPGTRPPGRKVDIDRRKQKGHYLAAGGGEEGSAWLDALLGHAEAIVAGVYTRKRYGGLVQEEAFVGVAPRVEAHGGKRAVTSTRWLWLDVDKPGELPKLWALLTERPCHLLVESAGSGGVHSYWRVEQPLQATTVNRHTGELHEWIERANLRLIHALGSSPDGRPSVADGQCANRGRVMRLAGTINWKTGRYARIIQADFALEPYSIVELVGDLSDPQCAPAPKRAGRSINHNDPYKRIAPADYFHTLTGTVVPRSGLVSCPSIEHADENPSCSVGGDASGGFHCHGCGVGGAIYDLASLLLGGPTGQELRAEAFKAARELVVERFGDLR